MSPERPRLDRLLKRLRWTVHRRLATRLGGDERSTLHAPGLELAELREYAAGDDVRSIDWHVTARTDRPYVRLAPAERALDALLVVDLSASVDWGTAAAPRRERALELAAAAGDLLTRRGNRLALLPFADRPLPALGPAAGRAQLARMLARLRDAPRQAEPGPTDLAAALVRADSLLARRGLVLIVSDFLAPDGWQRPLGRLAARHEVVAAAIDDPRDGQLPDLGLVTFEDPETGRQLVVDTGDAALRARFAAAAAARADGLRRELRRRGVALLELSTAEAIEPALVRFLELGRQPRGRPGPELPSAG
jgi:uncharacterized protein (DUF58 family)